MDTVNLLLQLPFEVIALLATGYIGYRIAFAGWSRGHQAVDTICLILVFAALGKGVSLYVSAAPPVPLVIALAAVVAAALLWQICVRGWIRWGLGKAGITESDSLPTLWQTINAHRCSERVVRLVVRLSDGSAVMSEKMYRFRKSPLSAWLGGEDGSIALHVTATRAAGSGEWQEIELAGNGQFDLTYIPASRIADVELTIEP